MASKFVNEWLDGWVSINSQGFPVFKRNLTTAEIRSILPTNPDGVAQLDLMKRFLGMEDASDILQRNTEHVRRFMTLTPDNPLYQTQLDSMVQNVNSKSAVVANARRTTEQMETLTSFGGDYNKQGVYVNEGDNPCQPCLDLNGTVATLQEFTDLNMRPGDQCLGSNNCLCRIISFN